MKRLTLPFATLLLLLLAPIPAKASKGTVTVSANHTVYFAGHALEELRTLALDAGHNPDDNYWGDLDDSTASLPGVYVDLAGFGNLLSVSASGLWGKQPNSDNWTGPEGKGASDANISHARYGVFGISLLDAPKQLLVGVFVFDAPPDPEATPSEAPPIRDIDDLITTPALNQAFGIGASLENIVVPDGATRLCFGMHDGREWSNNGGSVEVTVTTIAEIEIKPETLNLKSKGLFTAFIDLPEGCDEQDIDINTVVCEGAPAVSGVMADNNKLIVKFNREDLVDVLPGDAVGLTVTGELSNGAHFTGSDTIRVISKGGKK